MGDSYATYQTTKNDIQVGTEVNTYADDGLKALAESQQNSALIYANLVGDLKKDLLGVTTAQTSFKNQIFEAAKIVILVIFILYILNYYNKEGKNNGKEIHTDKS